MAAQQQTDPMFTWAVMIGMLCVGILVFWFVSYPTIGPAYIGFKKVELYPLTFISQDAAEDFARLGLRQYNVKRLAKAKNITPKEMWGEMMAAGKVTGKHYRFIITGLMGIALFYVMFVRKPREFKSKYNLDGLISAHARRWPVITPIMKYNPSKGKHRTIGSKIPVDLPPFAEALYPEEWMTYNRIRLYNGVPDRDQIRRAFLLQLCEKYEGLNALPEHLYCLAAAFALKGARKRKECDQFLGEISKCWTLEKGFVPTPSVKSMAARTLADSKYADGLLKIMSNHAYVSTAFIAALKWARRQGGVLAPAQFVWMRGEDRVMWYPLNNLDRRAFHVEAAGAMAHYMAEVQAGKPLQMPRLDAAVVATVQYLSDIRPRIPELEEQSIPQITDQSKDKGKTLLVGKKGKA